MGSAQTIFIGNPEWKKPLGSFKRRWEGEVGILNERLRSEVQMLGLDSSGSGYEPLAGCYELAVSIQHDVFLYHLTEN